MQNENISDSVKYIHVHDLYQHEGFDGVRRCSDWVYKAQAAHARLHSFRMRRKENKDFSYNRHYEKTVNYNGHQMSKEEYLRMNGIPPLQLNQIGKVKRVVQGQYRQAASMPICKATDPNEKEVAQFFSQMLLQNMSLNMRKEIDARQFEEFLIGGMPVFYIHYAHRNGKNAVFQDPVSPNEIFFPHTTDPFLRDVSFIGRLHSLEFGEILEHWSNSEEDDRKLSKIFTHCMSDEYIASMYTQDPKFHDPAFTDFFSTSEPGKHRVIELWTLERRVAYLVNDPMETNEYYVPYNRREKAALDAENAKRMAENQMLEEDGSPMLDEFGEPMYYIEPEVFRKQNEITYKRRIERYWYFRYLTPDGFVLEEGESPYWNGNESFHPFVIHPFPFVDGEIHSFTEDCIPAQEYFNYYLIALDFYIRNAAKGVLMIDERSLSKNMSLEEVADQFVKTNGVILYTSKNGGNMPDTKTSSSIPGGFEFFIRLSQSMVEDISGATPAMQGKKEGSATSGVQYDLMRQQAATSLLDLLESYAAFLQEVARKTVKMMKCCYTEQHVVDVAGRPLYMVPSTFIDVDMDITITFAPDAPTYRYLSNPFLMDLVAKGQLPVQAAIEAGDFENGPVILELLNKYQQTLQNQMAGQRAAAQIAAQ